MDTASWFIVHVKAEDICEDIAEDIKTRFDASYFELDNCLVKK